MNELGNQYSFVLLALGVIVAVFLLLRMLRMRWRTTLLATAALVVAAAGVWAMLRPGASDVGSLDAAEATINNGNPTLVEFFSNFCAGCIAARVQVDRLVEQMDGEFGGDFNVLRVDIHTDFGRALRERYGFSYTPEFIIFDAGGQEAWRDHVPPTLDELSAVATL